MNITSDEKQEYYKTQLKKYPECKLQLYKKRKDESKQVSYHTPKSKTQIRTILENTRSKDAIISYNNLITLFSKFIHPTNYFQLVGSLKHKNDDEVYKILKKYMKKRSNPDITRIFKSVKDLPHKCGRDIMQAEEITIALKKYIKPNTKYIDLGCGDGQKTQFIGELLDLQTENIVGADISNWYVYSESSRNPNINFILLEKDKPLPIDDNTYGLVTALYYLHHIPDLNLILKEISRILKPNGYLLITEHDAATNIDKMLCDIEHGIFTVSIENDDTFYDTFYAQYYDWMEWDIILHRYGFKHVKAHYIFDHTFNLSPTRKFYSIYQKK